MSKEEDRSDATAGSAVGAVSALMEERRRYESWISALDQKRASTPDHVFTRVHADYQGRLDAVVEKLATHADGLRHEIDSLVAQLTALREKHQHATDERAEAELRAHVGELNTQDWERLAAASDEKLADLSARSAALDEELTRTRQLLADTQSPKVSPPAPQHDAPAAASVAAAPSPTPELLAVGDVAEADVHVPAAHAPEPVAPQAAEPPAVTKESAPSPRLSTPVQRSPSGFDELSFLRSVVESPPGPVDPSPSDEPDEATRLDTFARRSREEAVQRVTADQPLIMRSSGEELARDSQQIAYQRTPGSALDPVKDPAFEGAKTLKCGECGSLNYPTEWYCERCGAELASL